MEKPVLVWIRNDFRFHDNPALYEASLRDAPVVLVYIHERTPWITSPLGGASKVWLEKSLEVFEEKVKRFGYAWIVREGPPLDILKSITRDLQCSNIFWNRRYEQNAMHQDLEIEEVLSENGVSVHTFQGNVLVEPWKLVTKKSTPFQMFTPFFQAFQKVNQNTCEAPDPYPARISSQKYSSGHQGDPLISRYLDWPKRLLEHHVPGEEAALSTLEQFCLQALPQYAQKRDFPAEPVTSKLSPYLHFGEISPRRIWNMVLAYERKSRHTIGESFLRELVWREFAIYTLCHFSSMVHEPFKKGFPKISWRKDEVESRAWQEGKTGIPLVDAGMRQLWKTGWMHNRVRMVTASFLVKHLLHSWEEGAAWFWDTLVDADNACNIYNWQWVTGCGAGAPPPFRIFNPVVQAKRFDREGIYIKTFLPELQAVPPQYIHAPWEAPMDDLRSWGVELGRSYPWPIIDLDLGRKRALKAFSNK
jgi:deoxyribodipyrimidine photo-lyase